MRQMEHRCASRIQAPIRAITSNRYDNLNRFFDYTQRVGISSQGQATNALVEVKIKVLTGLKKTEPQMSVAKTYEFDAAIQSGQIPGSPSATKVRVRLFHDWTDVLVKDNAVLTLRLTTNGLLFDIKEFVITTAP